MDMSRKKILIFSVIMYFFLINCTEDKNPVNSNKFSTALRFINIIESSSNISVLINSNKEVDNLFCNKSSGYIDFKTNTLQITVVNYFNQTEVLFDSLVVLQNNRPYTLFLIKRNNKVSSILSEDKRNVTTDSSFIRLLNNSQKGEPFNILMKSIIDTLSFQNPYLFELSKYEFLIDTNYTPALTIISNGIPSDYNSIDVNKGETYTLIITDTYSITHSFYPYVAFLFHDFNQGIEVKRLDYNF
jgi:hypothetical protein